MKLGRRTQIWKNFFYHLSPFSFPFYSEEHKFRRIFCAFGSSFIILDTRFHLFMVQPVSVILILIGLGFRFYSRQSITSAQPVLLYPSSFLRTMRPLRPSIPPSPSSLLRHPLSTVLVSRLLSVWGFCCAERWIWR